MNLQYLINIYEKDATTTLKPNVLTDTIKLDESLDSGLIVLPRLTRKEQFKRFSIVNIKVIDSDETETIIDIDYLVYATESKIIGKGQTLYYEHTLGLIEPIKWFEKFQCGTLTFTQPLEEDESLKSLYDFIIRIRDLVPFIDNEQRLTTRLFEIDSDLIPKLKEIEKAPQIYLEQKNLRETLIQIFQVINAIPRIKYNATEQLWYLTADFVNEKRKLIDIDTNIIDYKMENDGENYGQTAELFQENALPDQEKEDTNVFTNSITEYISLRSDDIIVGESNQKLKLNIPMDELKSIKLLNLDNTEIDLTPYCFEKKVYDTLDFDTDDDDIIGTKSRAFFWSYKSDTIDGLFVGYGNVFKTSAIKNILNFLGKGVFSDYYIFKIEFIPFIENMRSKIYRIDREPYELKENMFDSESTVRLNQQERLNDLFSATKNAYGEIQRIGVDTISFSKKHYDLHRYDETEHPNGIYAIGDYTANNFIITKVERIYYRKFAIARYEATNNFNRIAQFIQVDKEFRPYNIALTGNDIALKRDVLMPLGFVEVDVVEKENELDTKIRDNFMQTFNYTGDLELPFTTAIFLSDSVPNLSTPNVVSRNLQLLAEKNTLKYRVSFTDTKLAGKRRLNIDDYDLPINLRVDTINDMNKQIATNYTNDNGEFSFGKVLLKKNLWKEINSDNDYPIENNEWYYIKYFMSLFLPTVFHRSITDANFNGQYLYGWYSGVMPPDGTDRRQYLDLIKVYDTYTELEFDGKENGIKIYYARDTNKVYGYFAEDILDELNGKLLYLENIESFETKTYFFEKDRSEILSLDMYLPVLPNQDVNDNIIIGDYLVKDNPLLFDSNKSGRTLMWYASSEPFNKMQTKKIYNEATSLFPFDTDDIFDGYITIPTTVYDNYNYFALGDSNKNMYLAFNQINVDGTTKTIDTVYFNFFDYVIKTNIINELFGETYFSLGMDLQTMILLGFVGSSDLTTSLSVDTERIIIKVFNGENRLNVDLNTSTELIVPFELSGNANANIDLTLFTEMITPYIMNGESEIKTDLTIFTETVVPFILNGEQVVNTQLNLFSELIEPYILNGEQELNVGLSLATQLITPINLSGDGNLGVSLNALTEIITPIDLTGQNSLNVSLTTATDIVIPINVIGASSILETDLSLISTTFVKGWEYVSTSGSEPTTSGYIDGGTDNTINASNQFPTESADNYDYGDFVYYKNTNSNLYYTYKVIEVTI